MSDNDQPIPKIVDELERLHGHSTDWFLQQLVSIANKGNLWFGITLDMNGTVVSGSLIDGATYFERFAEMFGQGFPGDQENKDRVTQSINQFAKLYDSEDADSSSNDSAPQFIHLQDAYFFQPGSDPMPTNAGFLWRCKINAVSGFTLGQLSRSE